MYIYIYVYIYIIYIHTCVYVCVGYLLSQLIQSVHNVHSCSMEVFQETVGLLPLESLDVWVFCRFSIEPLPKKSAAAVLIAGYARPHAG